MFSTGLARWADRFFMFVIQPVMLAVSIWWLVWPVSFYFSHNLFWVWIFLLLALFVETIFSYSQARYVGRTRAFLIKLMLAAATNIISFASIYRLTGVLTMDGETLYGLTDSVYFSVITWTTVGYGDFVPVPEARLVAAAQGFLGYVYMATIVGVVMVEVGLRRGR